VLLLSAASLNLLQRLLAHYLSAPRFLICDFVKRRGLCSTYVEMYTTLVIVFHHYLLKTNDSDNLKARKDTKFNMNIRANSKQHDSQLLVTHVGREIG